MPNLFVEHSIVAKARVSFKYPEPMTSITRAILIPKCDLIITRERKEIHASSDFTTVNPFEMKVHISWQLFCYPTFSRKPENYL